MRAEDLLNVLLDVEWVVGSFVADSTGQLLLHQMPPEFGEQELERTTVRLASIARCAELCELGVEHCAFSLNRYQLSMTRFRGGFLCVMVEAPVNRRALEMATRIALESLPALVDSLLAGAAGAAEVPAPRKVAALDRESPRGVHDPLAEPIHEDEQSLDPGVEAAPDRALANGNGVDAPLGPEQDDSHLKR